MSGIKIIEAKCAGCGSCVKVCPTACITMAPSAQARQDKTSKYPSVAVIDAAKCVYCKACAQACQKLWESSPDKNIFNAVEIAAPVATQGKAGHSGVWCFAEMLHGKISPTAYELLHIGGKLAADLGEPLCAVIFGGKTAAFHKELIARGAQKVYYAEHPALENFIDDIYAKCLADIVLKHKPNKFLLPATTIGRSLAAKTAILANAGLTADVTALEIDTTSGLMRATRPTFGGNLMATIVCLNARPEMCTLRPLTYPQAAADSARHGEIIACEFNPSRHTSKTKFVGFVPEEAGELDIGSAEIIVSGGRGLGKAEGFAGIKELAHALGGAVGASRAAVDAGWIAYRHQVGLTGRTVKPKVYIACGISGQVQHMAGIASDIVVAINKDPQAPMMQQAAYSVEGDLYELIPAIIAELKQSR